MGIVDNREIESGGGHWELNVLNQDGWEGLKMKCQGRGLQEIKPKWKAL